MEDSLNFIKYGNVNLRQLQIMQKSCLADEVIPIIDNTLSTNLTFPQNDSDTTVEELNLVKNAIDDISSEENIDNLNRYKRYDKNLLQAINSFFYVKGITVDELTKNINEDITPTIIKLKQKYQRPRPYQLGLYYKLKLFPYFSYSAHSPSYPSGHTLQAYVILNIIGNKYPKTYDFCQKMIDDVAQSRISLGHHYPSDNDASYIIGREILKLDSITTKYEI